MDVTYQNHGRLGWTALAYLRPNDAIHSWIIPRQTLYRQRDVVPSRHLECSIQLSRFASMELRNFTEDQKQQYCFDLAMRFSNSVNEARTVWRQEALSIPPHIEKETAILLLVASDEQMTTLDHTYPLGPASFANSEAQRKFFDLRSGRNSEFMKKLNELEDTIRKYLKSIAATDAKTPS
jgi:hypothetical protein